MHRSAIRPSPVFLGLLAATLAGAVLLAVDAPFDTHQLGERTAIDFGSRSVLGTIGVILLILGGWAVSLTLHEFGHAVVAYRGGDRAVAAKGYLTLDIRHYTDPVFSMVIPLLLLAIGGIPLPGGAVWINRGALRTRGVASAVSLAGPLSNLAIGIVLITLVAAVPLPAGLLIGLSYLAMVQVLAFVLNILPVPGLDGYGALEPYLSPRARELGMKARPWAPLALFAVIIGFPYAGEAFWTLSTTVYGLLGGDVEMAGAGYSAFMFWRS
ncbi:Zn-dependent protease (includes SpoIVFB) [Haloechinothrix alba]|uniref:Zn-dependent protease (Includes SpoIVFB) n=1 Tax=Haloechinothrix alba TaxID=664784 RepID=A0A238VCM0_9PSEU|nr:site-2 protease family protein [Haloechinothrix alba]SNR32006.1 Zn-dependent protease (includes SpoIVFB) [Haloechinothrix alba]